MTIDPDLLAQARDLKSESGENPEYDRALTELVARVSGYSSDNYDEVARAIGVVGAPRQTEWGFHAAASVWFNVNEAGRVIGIDVNVLDGVDHPGEMWESEGGSPEQLALAEAVYDRAAELTWELPAGWLLPEPFNFGGAI